MDAKSSIKVEIFGLPPPFIPSLIPALFIPRPGPQARQFFDHHQLPPIHGLSRPRPEPRATSLLTSSDHGVINWDGIQEWDGPAHELDYDFVWHDNRDDGECELICFGSFDLCVHLITLGFCGYGYSIIIQFGIINYFVTKWPFMTKTC